MYIVKERSGKRVLISTYWNVNEDQGYKRSWWSWVLISTYWNVNYNIFGAFGHNIFVLISTYWNVNIDFFDFIIAASGFNLNLLECKYKTFNKWIWWWKGFNLNLLECKSKTLRGVLTDILVLISTYWNVNSGD